ncbi:hypothetical protein V5P93_006960 [Actinokineospora auranticolor]|uniref:KAP-like P-loop domain-containing protein n=1 Tax=Actinokineospora auranticolor TaxID=155976 RepID=A0A2S6GW29_9PSEU|nr:P-loop NTPase fold protein [Actinokineospora auranticolor]PPK69398.1 hypothetical protein CLV40_1034 [Actinokineospora auranticolor]
MTADTSLIAALRAGDRGRTADLLNAAFDAAVERTLRSPDIAAGLVEADLPEQVLRAAAEQERLAITQAAQLRCAQFVQGIASLRRRPSTRWLDRVLTAPEPLIDTEVATDLDTRVTQLLRRRLNDRLQPARRTLLALPSDAAPGLRDDRASSLTVTGAVVRFQEAARRLRDGAIGLAGPRGVGKTTLIENFAGQGSPSHPPLKVSVSAPVQYDAREFVLHLFARVCQEAINREPPADRLRRAYWPGKRHALARDGVLTLVLAGLTYLATVPLAGWPGVLTAGLYTRVRSFDWAVVPAAALATVTAIALLALVVESTTAALRGLAAAVRWLLGYPRARAGFTALARAQLVQIRYLQTHTTGWSGKLAIGGSDASITRSRQLAEKPLTYPEITDAFHRFTAQYGWSEPGNRVLITIDELDKIASAEAAERFLNEIKGLFSAPNTQFVVSVSDDALAAFERRGLGVRDAFDSAFQEIVRVDPLSPADTVRLLDSWVVGLPEPFARLAHCLGGGLPREVRRVTRAMVELAAGRTDPPTLDQVCRELVAEDLDRQAHAVQTTMSRFAPTAGTTEFLRKVRALRAEPEQLLEVVRGELPSSMDTDDLGRLRWQTALRLYHYATLMEVFTAEQDTRARAEEALVAAFDPLASAKQALAAHPGLAAVQIDEVRASWGLTTLDDLHERTARDDQRATVDRLRALGTQPRQ